MTKENHPLPIHIFKIKKLKSLLAIVENSVKGDNYLFRNLYADENGKEIDVFENGGTSCCGHVSWILLALELIKHPHAAVHGTIKDLQASGWYEIKEPRPGAIIVWEGVVANKGLQGEKGVKLSHMGFYVGDNMAISNDSKSSGFPHKHHYTYNNTRKIEKIYWHSALEDI
ncbi:MAG: hypothetical protein A3B86_03880 [Candidatus Yanofskybacteria bacterium RIFCSPHIGHO2_02_FULL_38_22b]|uniref:NlpC/P60 domain-containing protein n=1 Tax=Candidatus Yanofskybacteria bacterium RIFCSPHIGHO2_02_FULL_38_22b TaxID=1802673 RepID=A0A1F8F0X5_9BACT|nr:MAG: hypothetical protein A2816_01645 [Candidatus Yanofskybacteria bacterium RIFCSPHIGHO2_01_FULL_39_44]OGN06230.1 MAG: hypothetical protein A3B86_03880 [Candidatus Yanofskybacteria bacterium RIFCSPHIGHO2_02_FULL_38_22b]OGN19649.1 MAG: hypothetical protein A2910_03610 [Candidatus Yanofskybacteria bacterium RIFCSPLOWO2_01_FULL_39_28]